MQNSVSSINYAAASMQCPQSSFKYPVSIIQNQLLNINCAVSSMPSLYKYKILSAQYGVSAIYESSVDDYQYHELGYLAGYVVHWVHWIKEKSSAAWVD